MKFENLGANNDFKIDWYNALTGNVIANVSQSSNVFGNLNIIFPDTLTSFIASPTSDNCPIMFFKLYPTDDTFPVFRTFFTQKK